MKDNSKIVEQLPYVDGVVECGDSRAIEWLRSNESLNGAKEPNSNKGTINRVPLMLYRNIVFLAENMGEGNELSEKHTKQINKLIEEFEYFGGEEFSQKIEDIIKEQQELGETNLELVIGLEEVSTYLDLVKGDIGNREEFLSMEGSLIWNIGHIAKIIGNKKDEDFYGNEVIDNPSTGVYDTMTSVIVTVNELRSKVSEFDNAINGISLQINGVVLDVNGIKAIVGRKAKVMIDGKEVDLAHDDAIEQLFARTDSFQKKLDSISGSTTEYGVAIKKNSDDIETVGNDLAVQKTRFDTFKETTEQKFNAMDGRVSNLEEGSSKIITLESDMVGVKKDISSLTETTGENSSQLRLMEGSIGTMEGSITTLSGNVNENANDISALEDDVVRIDKALIDLGTGSETINGDISSLRTDLNSTNEEIEKHKKKTSEDMYNYATTLRKETTELGAELREQDDNIVGLLNILTGSIDELEVRLTALEELVGIGEMNDRVSALEESIKSLLEAKE